MDKIDHLAISKVNYNNCIYSLAARDFTKALGWIGSAIVHMSIHIETNKPGNLTELCSQVREYEMLKKAIEVGAGNIMITPVASEPRAKVAKQEDDNTLEVDKPLTFDDVVGLDNVKESVRKAIVYPFKYKDIYRTFKRKSGGGILLYGAPGTGKTMIAKAIANEIDAEFISVNCSDIYSKWLGESQQNVKKLFTRARKAKRAVIFFDEFETLGCNRSGNNSESSGINGVVCELLAQIDGFCSRSSSTILVIAATNRPWDIDSALLRSGRFERHLYIDMPNEKARSEIIRRQMEDIPTEELAFDELAERMEGFSPADVTEVCNLVKDKAIMRSIGEKGISRINKDDFEEVLWDMHSTVSPDELSRLESFV